jgi:hypothetical protein
VAVLSVLVVIGIWWLATHGKGTAPGRLVAWLAAIIVVWLMVSLKNPTVAGGTASGFASGINQAITGIGHFLSLF